MSNLFGIVLLFGVGYLRAFNRDFSSKIIMGFASSLIGILIAGITIVLGG
jgi:hypothetical protein